MKKRMISILIVATMILSLAAFAVSADAADVIGDVDGDGELTILDATAIQRHLAAIALLGAEAQARGRVTGETELTILDATAIQRRLAGIITRFPVEEQAAEPTEAPTEAPTQAPTELPTESPDEVTKVKDTITIYFSNNKKWATVNAYVYNNATGTPLKAWPGSQMTYLKTNDYDEKVYTLTVDVTRYDRIIFNNGTDQTTDTPLTKASSGFFINSKKSVLYGNKFLVGVYPYGQDGEGSIDTVRMDYPDGYKKKVYIWTPEGYDPSDTAKKYSVLYMCDGQNLFGQATTLSGYEWECDETVLSMMQNGGDGVIVVGVEAGSTQRDHELTPNLGTLAPGVNTYGSFSDGGGKVFSDFVVDTVIPYVESHYNTNSIRGIAGSSSGGIEAFYIGMEHMDKFRYIGALSPAFILYTKATWKSYLQEKDFTGDVPRIYFFCGNSSQDELEQQLYPNAVAMEGWLKELSYPADQMITVTDGDATHSEAFWAIYFPEMLSYGLDI